MLRVENGFDTNWLCSKFFKVKLVIVIDFSNWVLKLFIAHFHRPFACEALSGILSNALRCVFLNNFGRDFLYEFNKFFFRGASAPKNISLLSLIIFAGILACCRKRCGCFSGQCKALSYLPS